MKEKKVSWLELFFDLVFVTAVSYVTSLLVSVDHYPDYLLLYSFEYFLMVFPMFWLWVGQTMLINRFGELIQKPALFMLPQMFFLILMTASFNFQFSHTFHTFLLGYLVVRLLIIYEYFLVQKREKNASRKAVSSLLFRIFSVGISISAISIFFDESVRYYVMYFGIFVDMILPLCFPKTLRKAPVHLPHLAERFGLFVLIVFGENLVSVADLLVGNTMNPPLLLFSGAIFCLISFMWFSYFYDYENKIDRERITNGQILLYGHFFLLISIMLLAANIPLLYDDHLNREILLNLLFGSILVFFTSKYLIFYLHRKAESIFYEKESLLVLVAFIILYLLNYFYPISFTINLYLLAALCLIEVIIQQGLHETLLQRRKRRASK